MAIGANFGAESEWVKNVLAADRCRMTMSGRRLELTEPRLTPLREASGVFPAWFGWGLRHLVRTDECLVLTVAPTSAHPELSA